MGTMVSLIVDAPDQASWEAIRDRIERIFHALDDRFSLYRPHSELSRLNRRELLGEASAELRDVYERAVEWRLRTSGAFTPERADGTLDLNGIVKAIAIERAGAALTSAGMDNWTVNAGGDVLIAGHALESGCDRPWLLGIADPADRTKLITTVPMVDPWCAIATSGTAERGDHVWYRSPGSEHFAQVTVVASDIVSADVLATAIIAADMSELETLAAGYDADVLAVHQNGSLVATRRLRESIA
jgi:thiamine biosynthesis lipoprotein